MFCVRPNLRQYQQSSNFLLFERRRAHRQHVKYFTKIKTLKIQSVIWTISKVLLVENKQVQVETKD